MSLFEAGDTVIAIDFFPAVMGVVCRIFPDESVQVFFAEGPHVDSFTCKVYPPSWLTRISGEERGEP